MSDASGNPITWTADDEIQSNREKPLREERDRYKAALEKIAATPSLKQLKFQSTMTTHSEMRETAINALRAVEAGQVSAAENDKKRG